MEYFPKNLSEACVGDDFTEESCRVGFKGHRCALRLMHERRLVHLDVKRANALWMPANQRVARTDFSLAQELHKAVSKKMQCPLGYRPPELFRTD